jgi:hypothetical protein
VSLAPTAGAVGYWYFVGFANLATDHFTLRAHRPIKFHLEGLREEGFEIREPPLIPHTSTSRHNDRG